MMIVKYPLSFEI